jgi:hypothetical protein
MIHSYSPAWLRAPCPYASTTVAFPIAQLPPTYTVEVTASQPCFAAVSGKTNRGFDVTLTPPSGQTLSAGTLDVLVVA